MNNRDELRQQISEAIRTYCEAEHNYVFPLRIQLYACTSQHFRQRKSTQRSTVS